jgi:hypothetical protein
LPVSLSVFFFLPVTAYIIARILARPQLNMTCQVSKGHTENSTMSLQYRKLRLDPDPFPHPSYFHPELENFFYVVVKEHMTLVQNEANTYPCHFSSK